MIDEEDRWLTAAHKHAADHFLASTELVRRNNRHEDDLMFWLVGLAGGAIYLGLQVVNRFTSTAGVGFFLLMVTPWGLSALCGIVARLQHARAVLEDEKLFLIRNQDLTGLPLRPDLNRQQTREAIVSFFKPSKDWTNKDWQQIQARTDALAKSSTRFFEWCWGLLGAGILWCPLMLWYGRP